MKQISADLLIDNSMIIRESLNFYHEKHESYEKFKIIKILSFVSCFSCISRLKKHFRGDETPVFCSQPTTCLMSLIILQKNLYR